MRDWELSIGLYTGILFGVRTYKYEDGKYTDHVLYIPFIELCLTTFEDGNDI
jgi:hypothetical protein